MTFEIKDLMLNNNKCFKHTSSNGSLIKINYGKSRHKKKCSYL